MKKINPELIKEFKRLYREGKNRKKIAEDYNFAYSTILYWTNEAYRKKAIQRSTKNNLKLFDKGKTWAQRNPEVRKRYMREYMYKRYHSDEKFRKRIIKNACTYQKKRYHTDEEYRQKLLQKRRNKKSKSGNL